LAWLCQPRGTAHRGALSASTRAQNAASIAKNILTTEAIVVEPPEKAGAGVPGGMGTGAE
jgi:hypothetical protein